METFSKIGQMSRLSDEVYEQILQAVLNRTIDPHQRFIQEELAEQMQVSRTPVREALLKLENEGVLERVGRSGFKLRNYTDDEVRNLYVARESVECYALGWLSQRADSNLVEELKSTVERLESGGYPSAVDYFNANRDIHRQFVLATGNAVLIDMFDVIWNRSRSYFLFSEFDDSDLEKSLEGHLELCDVLKSKDEELARQKMKEHIYDGLQLHRNARSNIAMWQKSESPDEVENG